MIYYQSQLMHDATELQLYLVSNPVAFTRYEDHEAALQLRLYDLLETALNENENPVALIEDALGLTYTGGPDIDSLAQFLMQTPHVLQAHARLYDHWQAMDPELPEVSLRHATTTRAQATETFAQLTLRSYLETLSRIFN